MREIFLLEFCLQKLYKIRGGLKIFDSRYDNGKQLEALRRGDNVAK
jgi:hypothetical protein